MNGEKEQAQEGEKAAELQAEVAAAPLAQKLQTYIDVPSVDKLPEAALDMWNWIQRSFVDQANALTAQKGSPHFIDNGVIAITCRAINGRKEIFNFQMQVGTLKEPGTDKVEFLKIVG
jgi:hypothetical protein